MNAPVAASALKKRAVPKTPSVKLNDVVSELMFGDSHFTDLHVETGQPVKMRRAARMWSAALREDGNGIVFDNDQINNFLDSVYAGNTDSSSLAVARGIWTSRLAAEGSLHAATLLSRSDGTEIQSCRVRLTVQKQSMGDSLGLMFRQLKEVPESLEALGLPVQASVMLGKATSGLLIVTGPTGAGKSTTLAAMVNEINASQTANILTIEDPIEFIHERQMGIPNQREVGVDTPSFAQGVKDALRFVTDVILIGEIRDEETMRAALRAGESGHLVIASLHAPSAVSAIRKMTSYLASSQADLQALSGCLVGIIAQALIPSLEVNARNILCYEVLSGDESVVSVAIASAGFDPSGAKLAEISNSLRAGKIKNSKPMIASVKSAVENNLIDPLRAAAALTEQEDRLEIWAIAPSAAGARAVYGN